jgi:hypothetical protein
VNPYTDDDNFSPLLHLLCSRTLRLFIYKNHCYLWPVRPWPESALEPNRLQIKPKMLTLIRILNILSYYYQKNKSMIIKLLFLFFVIHILNDFEKICVRDFIYFIFFLHFNHIRRRWEFFF